MLLFLSLIMLVFGFSAEQMIVVVTDGWDAVTGKMYLLEKSEEKWLQQGSPIEIVVGRRGLGWGIGLHNCNDDPIKQEGDGKGPAGIFKISAAFGRGYVKTKMPYIQLNEKIEAVDDPESKYYNQIIDTSEIIKDWKSTEKMFSLYRLGLIVDHNFPVKNFNAGSCIYIHDWKSNYIGTAGCTAMSKENMDALIGWLDIEKDPILVQLPFHIYQNVKDNWKLPNLDNSP